MWVLDLKLQFARSRAADPPANEEALLKRMVQFAVIYYAFCT